MLRAAEPCAVKINPVTVPKSRNKFAAAKGLVQEPHNGDTTAVASAAVSQPEASRTIGQSVVVPPAPPTARQLARRERVKAKRRKQKGRGTATVVPGRPCLLPISLFTSYVNLSRGMSSCDSDSDLQVSYLFLKPRL